MFLKEMFSHYGLDDWERACPYLVGMCQNDGYVKEDPNCHCVCPEGTKGWDCGHKEMSYEGQTFNNNTH